MKNNYFIIHGSFGSPFVNWVPWLRKELEKEELEVYTPDFPTGVGYQNYENWSKLLKTYVEANLINENTIIYAHSIAPIFVCKFLVDNRIKVKRLVFVCGFNNYISTDNDYDSVNRGMYLDSLAELKQYCNEVICIYSDNDPHVSFDLEKAFADAIATKQEVIKGGGHLNSESGYREFLKLLDYI